MKSSFNFVLGIAVGVLAMELSAVAQNQGGAGNIRINPYGVGGYTGVTRISLMQNHQVIPRNFFGASGVRFRPGQVVITQGGGSAGGGTVAARGNRRGSNELHGSDGTILAGAGAKKEIFGATGESISYPIRLLMARAARGSVVAQYDLGLRHLNGQGLPANEVLARRWLAWAAGQGHVAAQRKLRELIQRQDAQNLELEK